MKKIAVVVQRYGKDVIGGSETHARVLSEYLSRYYNIEVLTTCARYLETWKNFYKAGSEVINGINVKRFKNNSRRSLFFKLFYRYIFTRKDKVGLDKQLNYIKLQGPYCPDLIDYINKNQYDYDLFIFMTYLYFTTVFGLFTVPEKSVLIPTSHDEKPIYLDIFKAIFRIPRAIIYNTPEEKKFIERVFHNAHIENEICGVGIDDLQGNGYEFRNKYKINTRFILFLGRIDKGKKCDVIIDYFRKYKLQNNIDLNFVLIGQKSVDIPRQNDIIYLGRLSDADRLNALKSAYVTVHPSDVESFSLSLMESFYQKTPALVNGNCDVLKAHCLRSNGGYSYSNFEEFVEKLNLILSDNTIRDRLGENGFRYVSENYSWNVIGKKHVSFIDKILKDKIIDKYV